MTTLSKIDRTMIAQMGDIDFRPAKVEEEAKIIDVMRAAIRKSCVKFYGERTVKFWTAPENRIFKFQLPETSFVAEGPSGILSIAGWTRQPGVDDVARISAVFTLPQEERKGYGRLLLAMAEDSIRRAGISDVFLLASMNAVPFYKALGFEARQEELIEVASGHYISVLRMRKTL